MKTNPSISPYWDDPAWRSHMGKHAPWVLERITEFEWLASQGALFLVPAAEPYNPVVDLREGGGVYLLYRGGALVYVGQSSCFQDRIFGHWRRGKFAFDHAALIDVPPSSAETLEAYLIGELAPPENRKFTAAMQSMHRRLKAARELKIA